jgi:hypothetical protein
MFHLLPSYLIAVDLGQVNDYTAIAVAERTELQTGRTEVHANVAAYFDGGEHLPRRIASPQVAGSYDLIHLERLSLGTPYTALPARLQTLEQFVRHRWSTLAFERHTMALPLANAPVALLVDQTGVGRPVVDLLRQAGFDPLAVTITGGDQVLQVAHREYRVPKRNLVGAVQVLLQTRRLRWAASLPEAVTLKAELDNFKATISLAGHDSYGAGDDWREGNHDDLVLAVALGCWYGEYDASERWGKQVRVSSYVPADDDDEDDRRLARR